MRFNYPKWDDDSKMEDHEWRLACYRQSRRLNVSGHYVSADIPNWTCTCCLVDFDFETERAVNAFPCLATGDHRSNSICLPCSDKYFKAAAEKCYMIPGTGRKCTILYCPYRCCNPLLVQLLADGLTLLRTPVYIPKGAKWNTKYVDKNRYSLPTAIAQYVTVEVAVVAQVNHADVDELMDSSESSSGSNSRDSTYQPDESEGESETETAMADIPQEITTTVVVRRHDGEPDGTHDDPVIID
mmetsp:Transcript_38770/g.93871  ORF Transcript_38770/g.93871 Transcript_38770/m.93871 type:complete len:242 (+) Transcript_38770:388-1113(+)